MICPVNLQSNEVPIWFVDYSVLVENIPGNATKIDEWIDFFKTLSPLDDHGGKVADVTIALNNGALTLKQIVEL
jgi:hypothetical protein